MSKNGLIVFQKNAIPGKVKTRIAVTVGDQQALEIYDWLTARTHAVLRELGVETFLFFSEYIPDYELENRQGFHLKVQSSGDLGQRMRAAFQYLYSEGFEKVIILGTDCPGLTALDLKNAFLTLDSCDLVFGPALDGGYYLLGSRQFHPDLFADIPWSTDKVLELTLEKVDQLGLNHELMKVLSDIDTFEDWKKFSSQNETFL
jgi:rSAM/selenodomain-associated transferase 1